MGLGGFGMAEMIFIFLVVLLLFGAKRLPEIGSSLGKGIREFKSSVKEIEHELKMPDDTKKIHRTTPPPEPAASQARESHESPESHESREGHEGRESRETGDGEPRKLSDSVPTTDS